MQDFRLAVRALRAAPIVSAVAALTLALGIGANAAIFSVVDAALVAPLSYPDADRVVVVRATVPAFVGFGGAEGLYIPNPGIKNSRAFTAIAVSDTGGVNLGGDQPQRLRASEVTPGFFDVIGVKPMLGRTFSEADVRRGQRLAVLSAKLWHGRFGADPAIVGRTLLLNGQTFLVAGVMPPRVEFPDASDLWIPAGMTSVAVGIAVPRIVARLAPGVSAAQARNEIIRAEASWQTKEGRSIGDWLYRTRVMPLRDELVGDVRPIILMVVAGVLLVLLVSCINSANLLLGRVAAREHEFAVRRALGASRLRLTRQVLTESLVLSTLAGLVAVPGAAWTLDAVRAFVPSTMHGAADIAMNGRVVAAASVLSLLTVAIFGLVPSLSIRRGANDVPRQASTATPDRFRRRFRSALVVAEVAIALVLLVAGATMIRTVADLMHTDLGMGGERALVARLQPVSGSAGLLDVGTNDWMSGVRRLYRRLDEEIAALPGVENVGAVDHVFQEDPDLAWWTSVATEDRATPAAGDRHAKLLRATPGYFAAVGVHFLAGRPFDDRAALGTGPEAVVSERFARALGLRPEEIVGRHLRSGVFQFGQTPREIVGVVRDVRIQGPDAGFEPVLYIPLIDWPATSIDIVVKGRTDPRGLVTAIRGAMARVDPDLPLYNVRTFAELRDTYFADRRFAMTMMFAFGLLAFGLAIVGLYSVINYLVQLRTREIGIRMAIGASRARVLGEVMTSGIVHAAWGIVAGAAGSIAAVRVIGSYVHGFGQVDAASVALLAGAIAVVSIAATWLPARRATKVDPMVALRCE